jgi:PTH1 family peptidyl-tRNA hydrolase
MIYIVGLGNHGEIYRRNRHNVGFLFLDYISDKYKTNFRSGKGNFAVAETEDFKLFKPLTFMNIVGVVVKQIVDYYKISLNELLIVYDDADLAFGVVKFRLKGSAGSHNGMKSVIYYLESDEIPRIKIGIGRNPNIPLKNWVLSNFTDEEMKVLYDRFEKIYSALLIYSKGEVQKAIQMINTKEVSI